MLADPYFLFGTMDEDMVDDAALTISVRYGKCWRPTRTAARAAPAIEGISVAARAIASRSPARGDFRDVQPGQPADDKRQCAHCGRLDPGTIFAIGLHLTPAAWVSPDSPMPVLIFRRTRRRRREYRLLDTWSMIVLEHSP